MTNSLRIFGEMDVAATKDVTFKGKLNNSGITCMFVYCRSCQRHLPDVEFKYKKDYPVQKCYLTRELLQGVVYE